MLITLRGQMVKRASFVSDPRVENLDPNHSRIKGLNENGILKAQ